MIGGQYLDVTGPQDDLAELHRLKTGALFSAAVGVGALGGRGARGGAGGRGARSATSSACCSRSWTTCSTATAMRSSTVPSGARALADEAAERAQERLEAIPADTSVLAELVAGLAARTA